MCGTEGYKSTPLPVATLVRVNSNFVFCKLFVHFAVSEPAIAPPASENFTTLLDTRVHGQSKGPCVTIRQLDWV